MAALDARLSYSIGNCAFPIEKKRSALEAHSRDWKMSHATALGARVSLAKLFVHGDASFVRSGIALKQNRQNTVMLRFVAEMLHSRDRRFSPDSV